jgi:acetyl-CoA carboxylase biotin carboxyl carrier protein
VEPKEIRELIELISRSDFAEFELEERDGFKLKLVREQLAAVAPAASAVPTSPPSAAAPAAPAVSFMTPASSAAASTPAPAEDGLIELKSPIVGTYYSSSAPESPGFVEVGARIKKGQVVCIVEAMKVMNEIESEFDAEVVEILVSNGQPVEFGEVLLRLRQP